MCAVGRHHPVDASPVHRPQPLDVALHHRTGFGPVAGQAITGNGALDLAIVGVVGSGHLAAILPQRHVALVAGPVAAEIGAGRCRRRLRLGFWLRLGRRRRRAFDPVVIDRHRPAKSAVIGEIGRAINPERRSRPTARHAHGPLAAAVLADFGGGVHGVVGIAACDSSIGIGAREIAADLDSAGEVEIGSGHENGDVARGLEREQHLRSEGLVVGVGRLEIEMHRAEPGVENLKRRIDLGVGLAAGMVIVGVEFGLRRLDLGAAVAPIARSLSRGRRDQHRNEPQNGSSAPTERQESRSGHGPMLPQALGSMRALCAGPALAPDQSRSTWTDSAACTDPSPIFRKPRGRARG